MNQLDLQQYIEKKLGLDVLPQESRERILGKLTANALERLTVDIYKAIPESAHDAFELLLDMNNLDAITSFITTNIGDAESFIKKSVEQSLLDFVSRVKKTTEETTAAQENNPAQNTIVIPQKAEETLVEKHEEKDEKDMAQEQIIDATKITQPPLSQEEAVAPAEKNEIHQATASMETLKRAHAIIEQDINELFGTKHLLGILGSSKGTTSPDWKNLSEQPVSLIFSKRDFITAGVRTGIESAVATAKMKKWLLGIIEKTNVQPAPEEKAFDFALRAIANYLISL